MDGGREMDGGRGIDGIIIRGSGLLAPLSPFVSL